jgi:hypothetical protein
MPSAARIRSQERSEGRRLPVSSQSGSARQAGKERQRALPRPRQAEELAGISLERPFHTLRHSYAGGLRRVAEPLEVV